VAGRLRLELAQYRELAAFAQFGSDLDKATQRQLARGARLTELLKQGQYQPLEVERQIIVIFAGTEGYLDDLDVTEIHEFETLLYEHMESAHSGLVQELREKRQFTDELRQKLNDALKEFKERFAEKRAVAAAS
jgi:F-type H+-transporting ATPase subunit alpha